MRIENDNGSSVDRIYIRQSWLGDALMCPERARLTELHPTARKENDSAMMGTDLKSRVTSSASFQFVVALQMLL